MRKKGIQLTRFLLVSLQLGILATLAYGEGEQVKLDLATAKRYAISHNYGIAALRHELNESKSRVGRTASPFLPKLGVAGGVDTENSAGSSESSPVGYVYGSYNLFNGFRDVYSRDIAKSELEKIEIKLKAAEFLVGLEVEQFFHTYLFKKNLIEMKDKEIELNERHQKLVQQTRERGLTSDTDVMEFQLKDANLRSQLVALKQELEDARSNLKLLLGEEIGSNIQPVGALQHQHVKGTLMDALGRIQTSSQAVKTMAADYEIAKTERSKSRSRWLPEVDLEARAGYLGLDSNADSSEPATAIALVAKLELYAGGDASWEYEEKAAAASKREAQLKDQINVAIRSVEMGFRNLKVIEARADLEKDNLSFAERYYNSVIGEYKRGAKNSYDLSNAADRLWEAQVRKLALEFDFIRQRVDVEKALGSSLSIEIVENEKASEKAETKDKAK